MIKYDLVSLADNSISTKGLGITSTIKYKERDIWRNVEVYLTDNQIIRYVSLNPRLKDRKMFAEAYKKVIE